MFFPIETLNIVYIWNSIYSTSIEQPGEMRSTFFYLFV